MRYKKGYKMTITKITSGEYKVHKTTLSWNEYSTYTGEIRIYKYPACYAWGTWGVVFENQDEYGNDCIATTEINEYFYTLKEAKEHFKNGGKIIEGSHKYRITTSY